mmetsp:Transcript_29615/g.62389  ORF Transcript_29615/g.62389 Transcript_29615/m.62389 type:complete len:264 (-) Transcript_29615:862-1653(-)
MSFVCTHDVGETLLLKKVCYSLVPKTNGTTTTKTVSISSLSVNCRVFLMFRRRIGPDAVGRHLLIILILVFVRGVDPRHPVHIENILYPSTLHRGVRDGTGNTSVNTEYILINYSSKRHTIKRRVGHLPDLVSQLISKPLATLVNERPRPIMLLPPIHVASFVITTEQEYLLGQHQFHCQQIRHHLETRHAAINVISQKDKVPCRQGHAQIPNIVREEVQVLKIAVYVAKDVGGTLKEDATRLIFQNALDLFVELEQVFSELF